MSSPSSLSLAARLGTALTAAAALAGCVVAPVESSGHVRHETVVYTRYGYPPPPRVERRPHPPGPDYRWAQGSWVWSGQRYQWQPGRWMAPPPPVVRPPVVRPPVVRPPVHHIPPPPPAARPPIHHPRPPHARPPVAQPKPPQARPPAAGPQPGVRPPPPQRPQARPKPPPRSQNERPGRHEPHERDRDNHRDNHRGR